MSCRKRGEDTERFPIPNETIGVAVLGMERCRVISISGREPGLMGENVGIGGYELFVDANGGHKQPIGFSDLASFAANGGETFHASRKGGLVIDDTGVGGGQGFTEAERFLKGAQLAGSVLFLGGEVGLLFDHACQPVLEF